MYCSHIYKIFLLLLVCVYRNFFCLPLYSLGALYSLYKLLLLWCGCDLEAFFSSNCTQK